MLSKQSLSARLTNTTYSKASFPDLAETTCRAIATVPGIDALLIGCADLSME